MTTLTVENVGRGFNKLNLGFTTGYVKSLVQRGNLERVSREYNDRRYSVCGYNVSTVSVVEYLKGKGFTDESIRDALPDVDIAE